jgi:cell division protein FtsQ
MVWRRRTRTDAPVDPDTESAADGAARAPDVGGPEDREPDGHESGGHEPDVVILDELSRVFAIADDHHDDHHDDHQDDHHDDAHDAPHAPDGPDVADGSDLGGGESVTIRRADPPSPAADATSDEAALADVAVADGSTGAPSIISIGGDDDLPDAVYLDEELGDDSASGPVFIDDDGSSDAIMPRDATARGIEPRLRERRIGVRRAASRRRLWWAALGAVVLAVVIGALALLGSSWFAVDQVTVVGNVYTDREELAAVVDDLRGTPVLLVDNEEFEARVEEIAWVETARVTTQFPDAATIEIRERTPVASMLGEDLRSRVLDADGRVLAVIDGQPVALVWISGPGTLDLIPGDFAPIGYSSAASLVTKLTPSIRSRVESMLVTPDGSDLVLVLTSPNGPVEVRFGSAIGDNAQIEKLVRLERKLADLGDEPVTVIDVSTAEVTAR